MSSIDLIVGLGNPGQEYAATRHNVGFWYVDMLANRHGGSFRPDGKFHGDVAKVELDGHACWLLKPQTYMNRSGQAIAALAAYYKIPAQRILVAHDELDFGAGTVKMKQSGGHGGHNGLRSTISALGSQDFLRLRIGIGHPGSKELVAAYVLHAPSKEDRALIDDALDEAVATTGQIVAGHLEKAMQRLHSRPAPNADAG